MLLQRIITALILVPLVVLAVFQLHPEYFSLLLGLITLLAAWEWTNLIGINSPFKRGLFLVTLILPMVWLHFWTQFLEVIAQVLDWPDVRNYSGILEWLVVPPVLFWILMMILIRNTPEGILKLELKTRYKVLIGWFVLFTTWMFLSRLRAFYGSELTLYFLILIWVADIAAYFAGKKFGKTQLAPAISPGKTVQGMYGALIAGGVCAIVLSLIYGFPWMVASDFLMLSITTVLISIYGDLFFSVAKRQRGVKDTGSILPGHGGILDRIDSLIAAVPFFYAGIYLIYP
ncbi:phosphatidate cytidylyltransferase [Candidatus Methylobacter oryzae]|uniref:Phosphatidate cytidylyltransferase n=1 Tax=Candidatus Methylobacter oryzae TaxID=2497749 RepID=A0ABY3CFN0_9GAMM|nr:phosphatidate cytidylyltransferase [Candidatus Methylobacter oryzae]TRX02572.1 phosphatidate cytidylyltransferase [Candidatus Methylobacter oryzae]